MLVRRDWKTTALFVPALLLAEASAMAQAPQAPNPTAALTPVTTQCCAIRRRRIG
jgi:hypothetical protein